MRGRVFLLAALCSACGYDREASGPEDDAGPSTRVEARPDASPDVDAAPLPPSPCKVPLLAFGFVEGAGTSTKNAGILANGTPGKLAVKDGFPIFSTSVPVGALAPPGNKSAIDFGEVKMGQKDRGVDFPDAVEKVTEGLAAFTITGWINLRAPITPAGGNRILSTHINNSNAGFDFVQDGLSLRIGVNEYSDANNPPKSSPKLTVDPATAVANWVFFAVSYDARSAADGDGVVAFFFGSAAADATADLSAVYDTGAVKAPSKHQLTIGNLTPDEPDRDATGDNSRIVRGLVDEIRFFGTALSLDEVRCQQRH